MRFKKYLKEAPIAAKGWTMESIKKFEKSVGIQADKKGFFDACVLKMKDKDGFDLQTAGGFCASIKDAKSGSPMWRGKGKSEKEAKKDTKSNKFKKKLPEK